MLLALLLMASTASAAEHPTYYPPNIQAFVNCTGEASITMTYNPGHPTVYDEARQCLEDTIAPALEEAGKADDLRTALKALYLKSTVFLSERGRAGTKAAYWEATNAVKLETKLAGLANEAALRKPDAQ